MMFVHFTQIQWCIIYRVDNYIIKVGSDVKVLLSHHAYQAKSIN